MRKIVSLLGVMTLAFAFAAQAGEMDTLLRKLVEKGVLTEGEAAQIRVETQEETKKEVAKGMTEGLPKFVRETKFSGDFRLRYQRDETTTTGKSERDRERFRLRFGFETPVTDTVKAGVRLATGGKEPTSTNQTADDAFVGKGIYIDQAYVQYAPRPAFLITGGKIANPYYSTDLMWDSDVNPEGVAVKFEPAPGRVSPFFTAGLFSVDESSSWNADPAMLGLQAGLTAKIADKPLKVGVAWYEFLGLDGKKMADVSPGYNARGNSVSADGRWVHDYRVLDVNAEFTPWVPTIGGREMPFRVYGNYLRNLSDGPQDDTGWLAGVGLGKVKDRGDWEVGYTCRALEKDATVDIFSDSDFHGGGTNGKGHKVTFGYGLNRNATLNLTLFDTSAETGARKDVKMVQVDCNVKW